MPRFDLLSPALSHQLWLEKCTLAQRFLCLTCLTAVLLCTNAFQAHCKLQCTNTFHIWKKNFVFVLWTTLLGNLSTLKSFSHCNQWCYDFTVPNPPFCCPLYCFLDIDIWDQWGSVSIISSALSFPSSYFLIFPVLSDPFLPFFSSFYFSSVTNLALLSMFTMVLFGAISNTKAKMWRE